MSLKVNDSFILCSDKSKMLLHTAEKKCPLFLRQKPAVLNMATEMVIIGTVKKKGLCIHRFQIGSSSLTNYINMINTPNLDCCYVTNKCCTLKLTPMYIFCLR